MGCTQSKIENEDTVNRCKERKQQMERAVTGRNKFAAAHSATAMSLKNAGAALSDFAQGEVVFPAAGIATPPQPPPAYNNNFILPPPPLPTLFANPTPLHHTPTPPELFIPRPGHHHAEPIIEEENEDDDDEEETESVHRSEISPPPEATAKDIVHRLKNPSPPMPENKGVSWDYFFSVDNVAGPMLPEMEEHRVEIERQVLDEKAKRREMVRRGEKAVAEVVEVVSEVPPQRPPPEAAMATTKVMKRVKQGVPAEGKRKNERGKLNLVQVFVELDDCFLKVSECAHEVSRMLEATRLHYDSNFADKRGHINHSEKVMRVITWNKSFRGFPRVDDEIDEFDLEEHETHATVLDKMLAWEKKIFDEVKAGEQMKHEYQKKVASLNKLKKRGSRTEKLERMKATVSHIHTRYIVDMQSMDSTVTEINRLRDEQLYPKLVALVDEMATMWETMRYHHESQSKMVQELRLLDISQSPKETTNHHHEQTRQLCGVFQEWHKSFSELMTHKKEYVKSLNGWLKLNLVPIDTNWKEKVSSPNRPQTPPIQILLHAWHDFLEKLPDEPAKATINNFAAIINTIWEYQKEELEFRNRCENSRKDLIRKMRDFENWYNKYMHKRTGEVDPKNAHDKDLVSERQLAVESAKQKLEDDEEAYQRQCIQVREKSLISLKSHLPELFQALSDFSLACSVMYSTLRSISRSISRSRNRT